MIFTKIINILPPEAKMYQRLECTKIDFGWGSAPDPAGGAYSTPPGLQLDLMRPTSKGKKGVQGSGGATMGKGKREGKAGRE